MHTKTITISFQSRERALIRKLANSHSSKTLPRSNMPLANNSQAGTTAGQTYSFTSDDESNASEWLHSTQEDSTGSPSRLHLRPNLYRPYGAG